MTQRRRIGFGFALGAALTWLVPTGPALAEDAASGDIGAAAEDTPDAGPPAAAPRDGLRPDRAQPKQEDLRRERQYWWKENRQHQWKEQRQHWWQHPRETGK